MSHAPAFDRLLAQLSLPLIQAPMAGVSTPTLAAAVANAGALGSLALGAMSADQAATAIQTTRTLTQRPFLVNVFCHGLAPRDTHREATWIAYFAPLYAALGIDAPRTLQEPYLPFAEQPELYDTICRLRPEAVSFHFGLPPQAWLHTFHELGIVTLATATNLAEAHMIADFGMSAVVAQGIEAGGHRGLFDPHLPDPALSTLDFVAQCARTLPIPVVAAGGIMHGTDIHVALTRGAVAAQLGTAFLLCPEAHTTAAHRHHLAQERHTVMTAGISGRPARGLYNHLIAHVIHPDAPPPPAYPVAYDLVKHLNAHAPSHHWEYGAHWAGTGVSRIRAYSATELVRILYDEWQQARRLSPPSIESSH